MRNRSLKIENGKNERERTMIIQNHNHIKIRILDRMVSKITINSKSIELNRIVDQEEEVEEGVEEIDKKMVTNREQLDMKIERDMRMKIKIMSQRMWRKRNSK